MNWINRWLCETLSTQSTENFYDQKQKTMIGRVTGNMDNFLYQTNSRVALCVLNKEITSTIRTKLHNDNYASTATERILLFLVKMWVALKRAGCSSG